MKIGQAAQKSGLPVKATRNDEEIGLADPVLHKFAFQQCSRGLGLSFEDNPIHDNLAGETVA